MPVFCLLIVFNPRRKIRETQAFESYTYGTFRAYVWGRQRFEGPGRAYQFGNWFLQDLRFQGVRPSLPFFLLDWGDFVWRN